MIVKKGFDDERGFTLVETLVALALFSVVVIISVSVLLTVMRSTTKAKIINRLRSNAARVMEEIERDVRAADEVLTATSTTTNLDLRINGDSYYRYAIVQVANQPDYIQQLVCADDGFSVDCTTSVLTPTDLETGLNVNANTVFTIYSDREEVKVTLVFEQPEPILDKPEYNATIQMESSIVLRNY